jgi:transposase
MDDLGIRTYISEPDRGRRTWRGTVADQKRLYDNRRRLRGERSKRLHRKGAELTERTVAHMYETGGMRRLHLRGSENILKRLLFQGAALNLGLPMRKRHGAGTPRRQKRANSTCIFLIFAPIELLDATSTSFGLFRHQLSRRNRLPRICEQPLLAG